MLPEGFVLLTWLLIIIHFFIIHLHSTSLQNECTGFKKNESCPRFGHIYSPATNYQQKHKRDRVRAFIFYYFPQKNPSGAVLFKRSKLKLGSSGLALFLCLWSSVKNRTSMHFGGNSRKEKWFGKPDSPSLKPSSIYTQVCASNFTASKLWASVYLQ